MKMIGGHMNRNDEKFVKKISERKYRYNKDQYGLRRRYLVLRGDRVDKRERKERL